MTLNDLDPCTVPSLPIPKSDANRISYILLLYYVFFLLYFARRESKT